MPPVIEAWYFVCVESDDDEIRWDLGECVMDENSHISPCNSLAHENTNNSRSLTNAFPMPSRV